MILMEARLDILYKKADQYELLEKLKGKSLEGKFYQPMFPYFQHLRQDRSAFRVLCDGYVTTESGTGIVHQAPYFGEVFC